MCIRDRSLLVNGDDNSADADDSRAKRRQKYVYTVTDPPGSSDTSVLKRQVAELQQALAQATKGMAARWPPPAMATGPWKGPVQESAAAPKVSVASESANRRRHALLHRHRHLSMMHGNVAHMTTIRVAFVVR